MFQRCEPPLFLGHMTTTVGGEGGLHFTGGLDTTSPPLEYDACCVSEPPHRYRVDVIAAADRTYTLESVVRPDPSVHNCRLSSAEFEFTTDLLHVNRSVRRIQELVFPLFDPAMIDYICEGHLRIDFDLAKHTVS